MSIYLHINRQNSSALVKKMNPWHSSILSSLTAFMKYERKQNLKVGRIRPHGGQYCSCIISLWFHDGIYKVCSTCK